MSVRSTPSPTIVMTEPQPNSAFAWTQASWGRVLTCTPLQNVARHLFTIANLELRDRREEWDALAAEMDVAPDAIRPRHVAVPFLYGLAKWSKGLVPGVHRRSSRTKSNIGKVIRD